MPEEKNKKDLKVLVVSQLPVQNYNETEVDGEKVKLITIEEALTEILERVTRIERSVA